MKKKTALQFRQQFGSILDQLNDDGEPVLIERRSMPVAVVVPYKMFKLKLLELESAAERQVILSEFINAAKPSAIPTIKLLNELRYGPIAVYKS